jgi:hypothetical protein
VAVGSKLIKALDSRAGKKLRAACDGKVRRLAWGGMFGSGVVVVTSIQDSTSSGLVPGSSYSCCIRDLRALVHK